MFTGRRWDSESGTYYYRARQYNPLIGRFLQRDPIGYYDSLNLYQYVGNNPGNWVDPYGLLGELVWVPVTIYIIAIVAYICTKTGQRAIWGAKPITIQLPRWLNRGDDNVNDKPSDNYDDSTSSRDGNRQRANSPARGEPNTSEVYGSGDDVTERYFGDDGKAEVDIDYGHNHGQGDPHYHEWDWSKNKNPRGPEVELPRK